MRDERRSGLQAADSKGDSEGESESESENENNLLRLWGSGYDVAAMSFLLIIELNKIPERKYEVAGTCRVQDEDIKYRNTPYCFRKAR